MIYVVLPNSELRVADEFFEDALNDLNSSIIAQDPKQWKVILVDDALNSLENMLQCALVSFPHIPIFEQCTTLKKGNDSLLPLVDAFKIIVPQILEHSTKLTLQCESVLQQLRNVDGKKFFLSSQEIKLQNFSGLEETQVTQIIQQLKNTGNVCMNEGGVICPNPSTFSQELEELLWVRGGRATQRIDGECFPRVDNSRYVLLTNS